MTYVYFEEEINKETVQELVDRLSSIEGEIKLWFSSVGGLATPMYFLLDYLNSRQEEITVVLIDEVCSAGFFILTDFCGKIELSEHLDYLMVHKIDRRVFTLKRDKIYSEDELVKQTEESNKQLLEKLKKLGLSKEQLEEFDKGYDVVLYRKDFKQLKLNK